MKVSVIKIFTLVFFVCMISGFVWYKTKPKTPIVESVSEYKEIKTDSLKLAKKQLLDTLQKQGDTLNHQFVTNISDVKFQELLSFRDSLVKNRAYVDSILKVNATAEFNRNIHIYSSKTMTVFKPEDSFILSPDVLKRGHNRRFLINFLFNRTIILGEDSLTTIMINSFLPSDSTSTKK